MCLSLLDGRKDIPKSNKCRTLFPLLSPSSHSAGLQQAHDESSVPQLQLRWRIPHHRAAPQPPFQWVQPGPGVCVCVLVLMCVSTELKGQNPKSLSLSLSLCRHWMISCWRSSLWLMMEMEITSSIWWSLQIWSNSSPKTATRQHWKYIINLGLWWA